MSSEDTCTATVTDVHGVIWICTHPREHDGPCSVTTQKPKVRKPELVYHCPICNHRHPYYTYRDALTARLNPEDRNKTDWQCPKCEAWVSDEDEDELAANIPLEWGEDKFTDGFIENLQ